MNGQNAYDLIWEVERLRAERDKWDVERKELEATLLSVSGYLAHAHDTGWSPSPKFREMFPELSAKIDAL